MTHQRSRKNGEIMRVTTLLIIILCASQAEADSPFDTRYPRKEVTINFLYEACSVVGETAHGNIPFFDCESYVYGVLDTYLATRSAIPVAKRACFPAALPPWQALEIARPLTLGNIGDQTAGPLIIEALRKQYPCI
jgi:hypothetical protein